MVSPVGSLAWNDVLDLAATLSGVARVRGRFLAYGVSSDVPGTKVPPERDGHLSERTTALARAGLYNFLAASFGEPPTDEHVGALCESGAIPLLVSKGIGGDGLRTWGKALRPDRLAFELSAAYSQAFLRPHPQRSPLLASDYIQPAPPLEAVAAMSLSHGPAAEAVEAAYREAGLVVGGDGPIAPQHLSVELQFMHHCAACEAAAWGDGDPGRAGLWRRRQSRFLSNHLRQWAGGLADGLTRAEAHPYYRALADLTVRFLSADSLELAQPDLVPTG
jgi:TorA maturation chaperone TorD